METQTRARSERCGRTHLDVVGCAVAGHERRPLLVRRVVHLQVVGLDGTAAIVGGTVPGQRQSGTPHVGQGRNLGGRVRLVWRTEDILDPGSISRRRFAYWPSQLTPFEALYQVQVSRAEGKGLFSKRVDVPFLRRSKACAGEGRLACPGGGHPKAEPTGNVAPPPLP